MLKPLREKLLRGAPPLQYRMDKAIIFLSLVIVANLKSLPYASDFFLEFAKNVKSLL
jgi:hypothetical protein